MTVYHLKTPVKEEEVRKLKIRDILYISGKMFTARDEGHKKMLEMKERGKELPFNPSEMVMFHCGPLIRKKSSDEWEVVAAGPTTSIRMEVFEDEFIKEFKTRVIVGKGGMGERTAKAMQKFGAVYAAYTGGAAVLAAKAIKKVENVFWLDELGMPEAAWILNVDNFGPLVVTIDCHGGNLTEEIIANV